jgi:hypothetical protein
MGQKVLKIGSKIPPKKCPKSAKKGYFWGGPKRAKNPNYVADQGGTLAPQQNSQKSKKRYWWGTPQNAILANFLAILAVFGGFLGYFWPFFRGGSKMVDFLTPKKGSKMS